MKHLRFPTKMLAWLLAVGLTLVAQPGLAEAYSLNRTLGAGWEVQGQVDAPVGFGEVLYQYKYTQQRAASLKEALNQQLKAVDASLALTADTQSKAYLFSGNHPCMLSAPAYLPEVALVSDAQGALLETLLQTLEAASFHPWKQPWLLSTLGDIYANRNLGLLGGLMSWEDYCAGVRNENKEMPLEGEDVFLVLVPEVDGYPILPQLCGNFNDNDVPMYVLCLLRGGQVAYMEMGCSYEIEKQGAINAPVMPWETAVEQAVDVVAQQWMPAWVSMAQVQQGDLDYPAFWAAHAPVFTVEVVSVQACYYAREGILRPGWQVNVDVVVTCTKGEDALTPQERHRYVPEVITNSYVFDAITGERAS